MVHRIDWKSYSECVRPLNTIFAFWIPFIFWTLLISVISEVPGQSTTMFVATLNVDFDATAFGYHAGVFAGFAFLLYRALNRHISTQGPILVVTAIAGTEYGIIDELHQLLVPGRVADFVDVGYDVVGVVSGVLIAVLWKQLAVSRSG